MIWFGSSAGVALSNSYPESKSVVLWLRHGWHVTVAYVVGFSALMIIAGWYPHAPHKTRISAAVIVDTLAMALDRDVNLTHVAA
jgi:hypothetical protein